MENESRNKHMLLGFLGNLANSSVTSILGFISRTVFIYYLGKTYLGLSGLLTNIFGILSITELGIANAITFSLYKPLANKEYKMVSILMTVYRKAYLIIGCLVFILGLILLPFLDFFIAPNQQPADIIPIYLVYLLSTAIGYFFYYKTTLITADQKGYKLVPIQMKYSILMVIMQIVVIIIFKSYIVYLVVQVSFNLLSAYMQNKYVSKEYTEVDFYEKEKLPKEERKEIVKNIKGLLVLKLGDFCVNSTDNLIITKFVNLATVGVYSNYIMLRDLVNTYIRMVFNNAGASFGNVLVTESKGKQRELFENLNFLAFWIYSFEAVCFFGLFNLFIELWIGKDYLFSAPVVFLIVINNFLTGLRVPIITIKNSAGLYYEDRMVPIIFAVVNLVASVILAQKFGISGVILGTIIGSFCFADWYRPYLVYKKIFNVSVLSYYIKNIFYIIMTILEMLLIYIITKVLLNQIPLLLQFIIVGCICLILPNLLNVALFHRRHEFQYLKRLVINIVNMIKNKVTQNKK